MKRAFCIEKADDRDEFLSEALIGMGYTLFSYGEEEKLKNYQKIYIVSILRELSLENVLKMENNAVLFSRNPNDEEIIKTLKSKSIKQYNCLEDETFVVKNAVLTAEGALYTIIGNTKLSLKNLSVLIFGYGRVGKAVTKILKDNYSYTAVVCTTDDEFALASIYADKSFTLSNYKKNLKDYAVIVNTIPKMIIKGDELKLVDKDSFLIDLASKPGGIDFEKAKVLGLNYCHALGLPGKYSPKAAGLLIRDFIIDKLE